MFILPKYDGWFETTVVLLGAIVVELGLIAYILAEVTVTAAG